MPDNESVPDSPWTIARRKWEEWLGAVVRDPERSSPDTSRLAREYRAALDHARRVAPMAGPNRSTR